MTVIEDEALEEVYNKLERIHIDKVYREDVYFIVYSSIGAMGTPGDFILLTRDFELSENNYMNEELYKDDIVRFIPELNELDYRNYLGEKLHDWDTLNMGYGNYLFINKRISKKFYEMLSYYMKFKIKEYDPQELYLNWLFGALATLKTEESERYIYKKNKISKKDLMNLKEEDVMFITNPGRMGDEDGSTFVIKKDDSFIVYRVDGWMYPNKDDKNRITIYDMFKAFPKWKDTWDNYCQERYEGKYVYIYMGFGNGLCIDKSIFGEYLPYLQKEVKKNGWDTPINIIDTNPGVAGSWEKALENMINNML